MTENVIELPRGTYVPAWEWGDRIRKVRRDRCMSQAVFAELIGVGEKALAAWESGASSGPDKPNQMAEHLEVVTGVDRRWWLGWLDTPPHTPGTPAYRSNSGWSRNARRRLGLVGSREHTTGLIPSAA